MRVLHGKAQRPEAQQEDNSISKRRKLRENFKRAAVRGGRRLCARNTRSSIDSSIDIPTNHTTRAWRSVGAHASGRNMQPRVDRRQANEKSSRGKGNIS
jgi:hypothetical protein